MSVLAALTPPFLVCAVVITAVVAFLRHEMARGRDGRGGDSDDKTGLRPNARDGQDAGTSREADAATSARYDG